MGHGWVHEFCPDVAYCAGGVVHADEAEGKVEVARALTSASPRGRRVQGVPSQTDPRGPSLLQLFTPSTEIASPTLPRPARLMPNKLIVMPSPNSVGSRFGYWHVSACQWVGGKAARTNWLSSFSEHGLVSEFEQLMRLWSIVGQNGPEVGKLLPTIKTFNVINLSGNCQNQRYCKHDIAFLQSLEDFLM